MAKKALKTQIKPILGKCRECKYSYDYHELTAYPPRKPFLCRCEFEQWSQFLDKECINGHFRKK
jgi:hypothetical protein